jgi:hypothetical protein
MVIFNSEFNSWTVEWNGHFWVFENERNAIGFCKYWDFIPNYNLALTQQVHQQLKYPI